MQQNIKNIFFFGFLFFLLGVFQNGISQGNQDKNEEFLSEKNIKLSKYLVDETNTLNTSEKNSLLTKLVNFEKETSNQLVVYIIPSLNGEPIEEVANSIAEKNKIGHKGKDNGIFLLIAMSDRKMRIETGYGLEGALPDALAKQIIEKDIKPSFREGKYYEGLSKGIDAIINATKGEYKAEKNFDKKSSKRDFPGGICGIPIAAIVLIFIVIFFIVVTIIKNFFGGGLGGYGRSSRYYGGSGGWFSSGSGGGWSSGGGGSFGGFSGGGGSFGGGGASGDW